MAEHTNDTASRKKANIPAVMAVIFAVIALILIIVLIDLR